MTTYLKSHCIRLPSISLQFEQQSYYANVDIILLVNLGKNKYLSNYRTRVDSVRVTN